MENQILDKLVTKYLDETSDNIIGVGYGFKTKDGLVTNEKSLVFTVQKKLPLELVDEKDRIPKVISYSGENFTTDVVELEIKLLSDCPEDFYSWQTVTPSNRGKIRPLKGGVSVTNYTELFGFVGTLGFLAVDNETNSLVGVTNNHVFVSDAFINSEKNPSGLMSNTYNDMVTQPNDPPFMGPSSAIGVVKRYKTISGASTNFADVALTTISQADINPSSSYLIQGVTGWTQPLDFATTSEINGLLANQNNLFSAGRTTGSKGEGDMKLLTVAYPVSVNVAYDKQGGSQVVQFGRCIQFAASASTTPPGFICTSPIEGGDSGSALIADFGGTRKIVGLVFAGSVSSGTTIYGFANRIDDVASAINISPWTGQTVNFSDTGATETYLIPGLSSQEKIVISGKTFWQVGVV